jgi:hypothetical protein
MTRFLWRKVIAIYEDDVFGSVSSSALLLSNALHAVGSELDVQYSHRQTLFLTQETLSVKSEIT